MRTQVLAYKFDTKSKPGKIICHGIRIETVELDADDNAISISLLGDENAPDGFDPKPLVTVLQSNFPKHFPSGPGEPR